MDLQNKPQTTSVENEEHDEQYEKKCKANYLRAYNKIMFIDKKETGINVKDNDEQFEEQFKKHCKVAAKAKTSYICAYKEMMSKLRAEQFEPLAEVLRKHEDKHFKNLEKKLADQISTKLYEALSTALEAFWDEYNIDNSIATLEMFKEHFQKYEGTDWHMCTKTIAERVRPKQMHMKKLKQIFLERQLQYQNQRLEKLLEDNKQWRTRIHNISNRRFYLHAEMTKRSDLFKENMLAMENLISVLLDSL